MIDEQGYRANVGIVVCNTHHQVLWAHRVGHNEHAWQFPQGGIKTDEHPKQAMYRELYEEIGLVPEEVKLLGQTHDWLTYQFAQAKLTAKGERYIGQKQLWFLLQLVAPETQICLTKGHQPEFDAWRWVDYEYPIAHVVAFKKDVYQQALTALRAYL